MHSSHIFLGPEVGSTRPSTGVTSAIQAALNFTYGKAVPSPRNVTTFPPRYNRHYLVANIFRFVPSWEIFGK